MRKTILLLILAVFSLQLLAQEECAFVLQEAQELFDAGLIETIPDDLSACIETGFTNEEQLQAFKLIILSYLFDDDIEKADEFMLKFLTEYPAYESVATDPREFVVLMESYNTDPVLMLGGGIGGNLTHAIPTLLAGINDFVDHDGDFVPGGLGFNASFTVERRLIPQLVLSAELSFFNNRYDYYLDNDDEIIIPSAEITDFSIVEYYETQNLLKLPISIYYEFTSTSFKPYVRLGVSPGILLTASGESIRKYAHTGDIRFDDIEVANVSLMEGRRFFNMWAFMGIGFNYKVGPGNFFLDARYYANLFNQVKPGTNSFLFPKLSWSQYYVGDHFLLNNYGITAGYMFPIYSPKKKEQ